MRKMFCALVVLCLMVSGAWADVEINATNFPDDTFREYVSSNFDTDSNDVLSDAEIVVATEIEVNHQDISSLQGVEYFTALTRLSCFSNQLTEIDVSKNTALTYLSCNYNKLKELDTTNNTALERLYCTDNQLAKLDLSNNKALIRLECQYNQLTTLDISNNNSLDVLYCEDNQLTELDLSNNKALEMLYCEDNQLTELDLSNNTALTVLYCERNQLTELDLSNCIELKELHCQNNQLTTIDTSNNTALGHLECTYNQLTSLDVSDNTALRWLECTGNNLTELNVSKNITLMYLICPYNKLATIDLANNTALAELTCHSQDISSLNITSSGNASYSYQLDLSDYMSSDQTANVSSVQGYDSSNAEITTSYSDGIALFAASPAKVTYYYNTGYNSQTMDVTISGDSSTTPAPASDDVEINTANFPDDTFRSYISNNLDADSNGALSYSEIASTTSINVSNQGISSLKGIEYFTALTTLHGSDNQLTDVDLSSNSALVEAWFLRNQLTSINLNGCTALRKLGLHENNLTALDVSALTLAELHCGDNQLETLILGRQPELVQLYCYRNKLTAVDVSECPVLEEFHIGANMMTSLDVTGNPAITMLDFYSNPMEIMPDLSNNTALEFLNCYGSHVTALDLSRNTALVTLYCASNDIASFDLSANTALISLDCWGNKLAALDLSNNTSLTDLFCHSQQVSPLRVADSGIASSPYELDFTGYMTSEQSRNVINVKGFDSSSNEISSAYENGVAYFVSRPEKVTYNYETGFSSMLMDVTISGYYGIEINETNFPDSAFRLYVNTLDTDADTFLSDTEISAANDFWIQDMGIASLKGIEYFTALTHLACYSNDLTELDLTRNKALTNLECSYNRIASLDLSNNTRLERIIADGNSLTSLVLGNNSNLKTLHCIGNNLSSINVSNCPNLETFLPCENRLISLDLRNNTALITLDLGGNTTLAELDVSNNVNLSSLCINETRIRTIDLSRNTALLTLDSWNAELEALDLSRNTELVSLNCADNKLTALDLTNNSKLTSLYCDNNRLRTLDLSPSAPITDLNTGNQSVEAMRIYGTGNADYPYRADFSEYVSADKLGKISAVQGLDSSNGNIATLFENGVALFAERPENVAYSYDTGISGQAMGVNIDFSNVEVIDPYTPTPPADDEITQSGVTTLNSHKYALFDAAMTWNEAENYCEELGGHLVTIGSQEEQDVVEALISSGDKYAYWLGGRKNDSGSWSWVDGSAWSYTNWASGQPDGADYLHIFTGRPQDLAYYYIPGRWDDTDYESSNAGVLTLEQHGFICEWDPAEANFAPINSEHLIYETNPEAYFADAELLGDQPSTLDFSHLAANPPVATSSAGFRASASALDARYDPRQNGRNFNARYQGGFATCWAHASLGALEASYTVQGFGTAPDLSRLHMAWFAYMDKRQGRSSRMKNPPAFGSHEVLDQGGSSELAVRFLKRSGTAYERDIPYPQNQEEASMSRLESLMRGNPEDYTSIVALNKAEYLDTADRQLIKENVLAYGAVAIAYKSSSSGYNGDAYYYETDNGFGHMVDIVGWDDNYSRENFKEDMRPSMAGAWLIKDSYPRHSQTGYFWMSYAQTIGSATTFIASEDISAFKVYGHDSTASSSSINYHWSANIFMAEGSESIRKIGIETRDNNTDYAIYVNRLGRTKPNGPGTPGNVVARGREPSAGYHLISLSTPVEVASGEYFSVILRVSNASSSNYRYYSAVEDSYSIRNAATISPNESYFARDEAVPSAAEWVDGITLESSDIGRACNARLTAYSLPSEGEPEKAIDRRDETPSNSNSSSSGGGGGGCMSGTIPAFMAAVMIAFTASRKKH